MRKSSWIAGLLGLLAISGAAAQDRPVLGRNGGAPVRAEAPVTAESLAGSWGENGNCNAAADYSADGNYTSANAAGRWSLNGDQLTLESDAGSSEFSVLMMNPNTIRFTAPDGAVKYRTRC
jgi:hypothetical protein